MKLPAAIETGTAQFDRLSLRERALLVGAVLVALLTIWTMACFNPLASKERFLSGEMATTRKAIASAVRSMAALSITDPMHVAQAKEKKLNAELRLVNSQLQSRAGGLIEPERMVQVIHDVLSRQRGVNLISLQNKSVMSLMQPAATGTAATEAGAGPYVHPVELVIEGQYLDVLAYLRTLEALPWHFNWKLLELETTVYPLNRVRIGLSTLSMDKDWIGV